MNSFLKSLIRLAPPPGWQVPVTISAGIIAGLFLFIFRISNASSYLSDKPETCVNCHVMNPQYATWNHSSHREKAVCNDCHVPHHNIFSKYFFKAKDGMRHATIFTLRNEPQVIHILEAGIGVVQKNCIRCHGGLFREDLNQEGEFKGFVHRKERLCWECHREVPHGRVNSLASVPNARIPELKSPVPVWLSVLIQNTDKEEQ